MKVEEQPGELETSGLSSVGRRYWSRRDLLLATASIASSSMVTGGSASALVSRLGTSAGSVSAITARQEDDYEWRNWSQKVRFKPSHVERPADVDEVVAAVQRAIGAKQSFRVAGTGHSFTPLCQTDDTLMIEARMRGLIDVDNGRRVATALAGSKLYHLHEPLRKAGFSMINLPDIDRQTLAGAIATGTHGTGRELGSLSSQVVGVRLVNGKGEVVEISESERPDLLDAVQVHLGTLGVLTHISFRVLPSYRLHEKTRVASFEECIEQLDDQIATNRHFEFFWVSGRDACLTKALNPVEDPEDFERFDDPQRLSGERQGHSSEIFPSARHTPFNETEYSLPAERGVDCLKELRQLMLGKHKEISWPLEYRTVAAEEAYLSPAHGRATVTISAHQAAGLDYRPFFSDVESVFLNHNGRPHWGKIHSLGAKELGELYPKWESFQKARRELDPEGRFLSPYIVRLLGS